jgi:hypothetical protein
MRSKIFIFAVLVYVMELACVGNLDAGVFAPRRLHLALGTLGSLSASPGTISFQASNPELGLVSGSSPGSLAWIVLSGSHAQNWSVSVQAGSSSFVGCATIPISAIRVTCSVATVSGGAGTGACSSSFPLSTTPQQVAGGSEGTGTNSYSVSMNFTLAESWRYVANSACTITITYTVNAP